VELQGAGYLLNLSLLAPSTTSALRSTTLWQLPSRLRYEDMTEGWGGADALCLAPRFSKAP